MKTQPDHFAQTPLEVDVDFSGVTNLDEVHTRLAAAFSFPAYYGKNWDAFWDRLTTLDPMPHRINIRGMKSPGRCIAPRSLDF